MRRRPPSGEDAREAFMSGLVGQTISAVVIDVDQRRHRLVMSQRKADKLLRNGLLDELEPGQTRSGTVRSLVKFGAFVDLGGIDGLIHISELEHGFVDDVSDVLDVGDEVEVLVLDVDRDRERIGLSRKRLLPDTWEGGVESLEFGQEIQGTVAGMTRSGMVVELSGGIQGLVPMAELDRDVRSSGEGPVGTVVTFEIVDIDHRRQRVVLRASEPLGEEDQSLSDGDDEPESRVVSRIRQQLESFLR
jgi:small subunit ribosomal protein S1